MRELRIPDNIVRIENLYNDVLDYDVIIIPSTVRIIKNSFNNCKSITKIIFVTDLDFSIDTDPNKENSFCHCGTAHIIDSFNGISVSDIVIPHTTTKIVGSFSHCKKLSKLSFDVWKDPERRHKGFGIDLIENSFDDIPIEQLIIPATVTTISSSFKHCNLLNDLKFDVLSNNQDYGKYLFGIRNLSQDSFIDSNLSNITIPSTVMGVDRFSFQDQINKSDFSSGEYYQGCRSHYGNEFCIIENSGAADLFIDFDGSTKYEICEYGGDHQKFMWKVLYEKHMVDTPNCPAWFNVFDGGVKLTNNNIAAFVIDGTICNVFLPKEISQNQLKSLIELIYFMNDRQNATKGLSFEMHIYYDGNIYDDIKGDNINLRFFAEYLIAFGICNINDFDFLNIKDGKKTI